MRILTDTNVILDIFLLDAIVTRNIEDFTKARLDVLAPGDFIRKNQEIFEKLVLD